MSSTFWSKSFSGTAKWADHFTAPHHRQRTPAAGLRSGDGWFLAMRMGLRQLTCLTDPFTRNVENHAAAVGLYFMHYNSVRVHQTLRVAPATEMGISFGLW